MSKDAPIPLGVLNVPNKVFRGKFFAWIKVIFFLSLALAYFTWTMDLIPAKFAGPIVGHIDDAIVFLLVAWVIRGSIRTIMSEKNRFLGK